MGALEAAAPEVIRLWPEGAPAAPAKADADRTRLEFYRPAEKAAGTAMVVCPGGGYGFLAIDHEGREVAEWLNAQGIAAFVLHYRLAPRYRHPAPLQDAQRAVRTVRARAGEWKIDPQRIGILGFSAGGHLAGSASVLFEAGKEESADPIEKVSSRPDFTVLAYPVISFTAPWTHQGSKQNLLGKDAPAELAESLSLEKLVTPQTPPSFLVASGTDRAVPAENSLTFYQALRAAGVPAELHLYERGEHGFGLGKKDPVLSSWPDLLKGWMEMHGFLGAAAK
jgi:acetyl esterase/lipase